MDRITIYDTTLRDGQQMEGMNMSVGEQLAVAVRLAELGVDMIEAGFPQSNPKDHELFRLLEHEDLGRTRVAAFGMTRRKGVAAHKDAGLLALVECFASVTTIVGKTWDLHLEKVTRVTREENLQMIEESVDFLVRQDKLVVYDAEHFFDAYRAHPDYALDCLRAAISGGASWLVPCDTNGGTLPSTLGQIMAEVRATLPDAKLGIHTHNDAECGVANSLVAVERGARMVQGTMNGYGERVGNANLTSIIPALALKMGYSLLDDHGLAELTSASNFVAETANLAPNDWAPYVGRNAFAHKGGMHAAGIAREVSSYEHIDPSLVGNGRRIPVSEQSGRGTIVTKAQELGLDVESDPGAVAGILERLKALEHQGYHFEVADASFELLIARELGSCKPLFELESFRVTTYKREDGRVDTEATIRIRHEGDRIVEVGEGNGPVNALDAALRRALGQRVPELAKIELVNFKVRILDETQGSAAVTRVLIDSSDGHETWGTIGVGENLIAASWEALVDSLEYGVRRQIALRASAA